MGDELSIRQEQRDLVLPHEDIVELFQYGHTVFGGLHNGSEQYFFKKREEKDTDFVEGLELPKDLKYLSHDPTSVYYVAYYADRQSDYFDTKIRGREICLSTKSQEKNGASWRKSITYIQNSTTGNWYMDVQQIMNEDAHETDEEVHKPYSRMTIRYRIDPNGTMQKESISIDRTDDTQVSEGGNARWKRSMIIKKPMDKDQEVQIEDIFITDKNKKLSHAKAKIRIVGRLENNPYVELTIGNLPHNLSNPNKIGSDQHVSIAVAPDYKEEYKMITSHPSYSFLSEDPIDPQRIQNLLQERISLMESQWNQPTSVFTPSSSIETEQTRLPS